MGVGNQLKEFWTGLTAGQRFMLFGSGVVVVATLALFVNLFSRADYKPLYSDLAPNETQTIAARLGARRIPYRLSGDGSSIRVPAGRLDEARLELAAEGLPRGGRLGFELFDKPNWSGSDFAEKVNFQRALEGELERTIQTMHEVEAVRVHLVLPRESLFTERAREAKAAVVIKPRGGRISAEAAYAMATLVASSVDTLHPENVTVINSDSRQPLLSRGQSGALAGAVPSELEEQLTAKLLATLIPVVGEERIKVSVTVERDMSSVQNTYETIDPDSGVLLTSQRSEERVGSSMLTGIPGTASNVPGASTLDVQDVPVESQVLKTESGTYAFSRTTRNIVQPPGRIRRITVAVLVDDVMETQEVDGDTVEVQRKRTPEEMQQIETLAKAAIGFDEERGDLLAVENLSFRIVPVEEPVPPTPLEQWLQLLERWSTLLRYVALLLLFLLVYLLMLRPIKKQVVKTLRQLAIARKEQEKKVLVAAPKSAGQLKKREEEEEDIEALLEKEMGETSSDVKRAVMLKRHLVDKVKKDPTVATRLVQNLMRQDEARR